MDAAEAISRLEKAYSRSKHLLRKDWREENERSGIDSTGFCYIATEALFYMLGGEKSGYRPQVARDGAGTHWWLRKGDEILDPTKSQYGGDDPPYCLGKGCGFMTGYKKPSKRAQNLMDIALMNLDGE